MLVRYQEEHGGPWKHFEHEWFGNTLDYATVAVHQNHAGTYNGEVTVVRSGVVARLWRARDWMVWIEQWDPCINNKAHAGADKVMTRGSVGLYSSDGNIRGEFAADRMTGIYKRGACPVVDYNAAPVVTKPAAISDEELDALRTEGRQVMMMAFEAINRDRW